MIGRLILWFLLAAFAIFWALTVFRTCNKTDMPLSKAKTSIEDTFEESGLSTNDAEISDADLDEFEGVDDETTTNKGEAVDDEVAATDESEPDSEEVLDDERPTNYSSSQDEADNKSETSAASNSSYSSLKSSKYMVVAGTFKSKSYANSEVSRLKKLGYPEAELVKFDRTAYYSVCAGRSNDLAKAKTLATSLKKDGVDAYVHTRKGKRR